MRYHHLIDPETLRPGTRWRAVTVLHEDSGEHLIVFRRHHAQMLLHFLEQFPETLNTPEMRFAVASTIFALPEPHEGLLRWAERLDPGPVPIGNLPYNFGNDPRGVYMETTFFPRWDARLGSHLIPDIDRHIDIPLLDHLPESDLRLVLTRVRFVGGPTETLSSAAKWALDSAPDTLIPQLLQPGNLLACERPDVLLDACQALPLTRRNAILPHIRKDADYTL